MSFEKNKIFTVGFQVEFKILCWTQISIIICTNRIALYGGPSMPAQILLILLNKK